jgi:hypothetical protein
VAGHLADEAAEGLVEFVGDPAGPLDLRCRAVLALGKIGLRSTEQAMRLFAVLGDAQADDELRWTLLMTFGDRARWAVEIRPVLVDILIDPAQSRLLRRQAEFELRDRLDDPLVLGALLEVLGRGDDDSVLREAALLAVQSGAERRPEVVKLLAARAVDVSEDLAFRAKLLRALEVWQDDAAEAVQVLTQGVLVSETDTKLRLKMVDVIGRIGPVGPIAFDLATVLLQADAPAELREAIAGLVTTSEQSMPGEKGDWLRMLGDPSQPLAVRQLALRVLSESGRAGEAEDVLQRCLDLARDQTENADLRSEAARYLQQRGSDVESAFAELMNLMGDASEPEVLREAIGAVLVEIARSWLAPPGRPTRQELELRLAHVEALQQLMTREAVRTVAGRQQHKAIDQVQSVLHRQWQSRWWDRSVSWAGRRPWSATGMLLVGLMVVTGLVYGVKRVRGVRSFPSPSRLIDVALAPERAVPSEISQLVQEVLAQDNPNRSEAVDRLGRFGPDLEPVIPRLIAPLENKDEELDLRFAALTVLGLAGQVACPAQRVFMGILGDPREPVFLRMKVMEILQLLAADDPDVTRELTKLLGDSDEARVLRLKAGRLLCDRSAMPPDVGPVLERLQQGGEASELEEIARRLS